MSKHLKYIHGIISPALAKSNQLWLSDLLKCQCVEGRDIISQFSLQSSWNRPLNTWFLRLICHMLYLNKDPSNIYWIFSTWPLPRCNLCQEDNHQQILLTVLCSSAKYQGYAAGHEVSIIYCWHLELPKCKGFHGHHCSWYHSSMENVGLSCWCQQLMAVWSSN